MSSKTSKRKNAETVSRIPKAVEVGMHLMAPWKDGFLYEAVVTKRNKKGSSNITVEFVDDGIVSVVHVGHTEPIGGEENILDTPTADNQGSKKKEEQRMHHPKDSKPSSLPFSSSCPMELVKIHTPLPLAGVSPAPPTHTDVMHGAGHYKVNDTRHPFCFLVGHMEKDVLEYLQAAPMANLTQSEMSDEKMRGKWFDRPDEKYHNAEESTFDSNRGVRVKLANLKPEDPLFGQEGTAVRVKVPKESCSMIVQLDDVEKNPNRVRVPYNAHDWASSSNEASSLALPARMECWSTKYSLAERTHFEASVHTRADHLGVPCVFKAPRIRAESTLPSADTAVTAFTDAFREKNKRALAELGTHLDALALPARNNLRGDLEKDSFALGNLQCYWGKGGETRWHVDNMSSVLHMAIAIRGTRNIQYESVAEDCRTITEYSMPLPPGSVYLSNPSGFFHSVSREECDFDNRVLALQLRCGFIICLRSHMESVHANVIAPAVVKVLRENPFHLPTMEDVRKAEIALLRLQAQAPPPSCRRRAPSSLAAKPKKSKKG